MYVQWESPAEVTKPYPIVLVHGGGGQGPDYLGTPDGRPGWATFLLEEGYAVYVVDRPGHGRAPFYPAVLGEPGALFTLELSAALFTDAANGPMAHPTAHLHTQWPGSGTADDPSVRAFTAGAGPMLADVPAAHALEQACGAALLDEIGPAILVTELRGRANGLADRRRPPRARQGDRRRRADRAGVHGQPEPRPLARLGPDCGADDLSSPRRHRRMS